MCVQFETANLEREREKSNYNRKQSIYLFQMDFFVVVENKSYIVGIVWFQ
jgi:hypothetical protein